VNLAFVCAKQDYDAWPDEHHNTSIEMVKCAHCGRHAAGGYRCDTCGHTDVDLADQLVGHGAGVCGEGSPS
jgi:primosomal protein N'